MKPIVNQPLEKIKAHPIYKIGPIWVVVIGIGICACMISDYLTKANSTPTVQDSVNAAMPNLVLNCPAPRQQMALDEIHVFTMTLSYTPPLQPEFEAVLESVEGADWESALCFGQQCFLQDGIHPLRRSVTVSSPGYVEVKIFVPAEAGADTFKKLRLTLISQNYPAQTAIEITGYLPQP